MWTLETITTVAALATVSLATTARAQTGGPAWNRSAKAIAVLDNATGGQTIHAFFEVEADGFLTTGDLSTEMVILVNGTAVHSRTIQFDAMPAGAGGPMCQSNQSQVCCSPGLGQPPLCICSNFVAEEPANASLQPGDEIMVLLRPAPGAMPEPDESDDVLVITYTGLEFHWNRSLRSIDLVSASGGPGGPAESTPGSFFDVFLEVEVDAQYDGQLCLGTEAELRINGVPHATARLPQFDLDLTWTLCPAQCEPVTCMSALGQSLVSCGPTIEGCGCVWLNVQPGPIFEGVPLLPLDIVEVILRPVPGALPELPGFPDDDEDSELVSCPGDTDNDGDVDVDDLNNVVLDWGTDGAAHNGDVTGALPDSPPDGIVDVNDLNAIFVNWGICFPV